MDAARDARWMDHARDSMLRVAGAIGAYRDGRNARFGAAGGVDPVVIRAAVLARDGHPMTPLPDGLDDEIDVEFVDGGAVLRCPIWTTSGRSRWQMTIECALQPSGFLHSHVIEIVHLDDGERIDASSAPCPERQGAGWADDADFVEEVWPAPAGDTRIPRGAFVGAGYGILFQQLLAGVHAALPGSPDLRLLNPGQAAIALLDFSYTAIYGDGLQAAYETMPQPDFESDIVDACEHIGAHTYADVFRRIRDLLPAEARGSMDARCAYFMPGYENDEEDPRWEALADELYALEDAGDLIWAHMMRYVHAHPEEFFLPAE